MDNFISNRLSVANAHLVQVMNMKEIEEYKQSLGVLNMKLSSLVQ